MWERVGGAHLVTIRIEKGFKIDDVGMGDESHDLQFTVLGGSMIRRADGRGQRAEVERKRDEGMKEERDEP